MLTRPSRRTLPVAAVVLAAALPASAGAADVRSPDARDASPAAPARVDLRTPDAVDGSGGSRRGIDVAPSIVRVSAPVVEDGFQWTDAGIGAGILFALLVLPAGGYALMTAHRRSAGGAPLAH